MRYLPLTPEDRGEMLARVGVADIDALFADIPSDKRLTSLPNLPLAKSEIEVERTLARMANKNVAASSVPFFVGCGAYKHHVPATVDHLIQRSEFLTSYTPYQPEIAQGTLHYLFEFQTQVALLTGMEVANASMYDGSTAAAEAVLMAHRITKRNKAVLSGNLHPHYVDTIKTVSHFANDDGGRAAAARRRGGPELADRSVPFRASSCRTRTCSARCAIFGHSPKRFTPRARFWWSSSRKSVSLGPAQPPGDMGADIVVGEGQSIGNGLNFGGPYVGLFATRQKYSRQMPGRLRARRSTRRASAASC